MYLIQNPKLEDGVIYCTENVQGWNMTYDFHDLTGVIMTPKTSLWAF
jgi:hypothetical protein